MVNCDDDYCLYNNSSTIKMMRLVCRPSRNNLDDTAPTEQSIVEPQQGGSLY